jgi:hypothetical protein
LTARLVCCSIFFRTGDYHRLFAAHLASLAQHHLQQGPETPALLSLCLRLDLASHHRRGVTWPHLCLNMGLGRRMASPIIGVVSHGHTSASIWSSKLHPPLASVTWHIKSATPSSSSTAPESPRGGWYEGLRERMVLTVVICGEQW